MLGRMLCTCAPRTFAVHMQLAAVASSQPAIGDRRAGGFEVACVCEAANLRHGSISERRIRIHKSKGLLGEGSFIYIYIYICVYIYIYVSQ